MKKQTLTIILVLIASVVYSQNITGQWSGTLSVQGNQLRVVFHVNKINNQYNVTMDSRDQNATGIEVTTATFKDPNLRFEISSIGVAYEGTLSDTGITGKWIQSGTALYLTLIKSENTVIKEK